MSELKNKFNIGDEVIVEGHSDPMLIEAIRVEARDGYSRFVYFLVPVGQHFDNRVGPFPEGLLRPIAVTPKLRPVFLDLKIGNLDQVKADLREAHALADGLSRKLQSLASVRPKIE